jgi:hypothetical protein
MKQGMMIENKVLDEYYRCHARRGKTGRIGSTSMIPKSE